VKNERARLLWREMNATLDAYHAGNAAYEDYVRAFGEWQDYVLNRRKTS
jgi:hypothetical protein